MLSRHRIWFAALSVAGLFGAILWAKARLTWLPVSVALVITSISGRSEYVPISYRGEELWILSDAENRDGLQDGSKLPAFISQKARNWNRAPLRVVCVVSDIDPGFGIAVCPSQNLWASAGSSDSSIRLWHDRTFERTCLWASYRNKYNVMKPGPVNLLSLSPDGKRLVASSHLLGDSVAAEVKAGFCALGMVLFDTRSGKQIARQSAFEGGFTDFAWSPDSAQVAGITVDGWVFVLDAATGKLRLKFRAHQLWGAKIIWAPDGKSLVTGSNPRVALSPTRIEFDLKSGTNFILALADKTTFDEGKTKVTISSNPQGDALWNGQTERLLKRFDARTGAPIGTPIPLETGAVDMAFSPDGNQLAVGEHEFALLLNAQTLATERRLDMPKPPPPGFTSPPAPVCVAWAPDGATLATSTARGLTLWRIH